MSVITALVAARVQQGKSQQEVAARIGVTRQGLAAWESFVNTPTTENLFRWADALEVTLCVAQPAAAEVSA